MLQSADVPVEYLHAKRKQGFEKDPLDVECLFDQGLSRGSGHARPRRHSFFSSAFWGFTLHKSKCVHRGSRGLLSIIVLVSRIFKNQRAVIRGSQWVQQAAAVCQGEPSS